MAHVLAQTSLGSVLDDRLAVAAGALGTLVCGLLAVVLLTRAGAAARDDEGLDELPFIPGLMLALGSSEAEAVTAQPTATPSAPAESPPSESQPTETTDQDDAPDEAVTDDATPRPPPRPPRAPSPPRSPSVPPTSLLPTPPAGPGAPSRGDPFGDPRGFDDLAQDGDAWARGVIGALEAMDVGTVYAKPIEGTVRFEITICKDGTVSRVAAKGGTATRDERDLVLLEVGRLRIPRPPAEIAAAMKGSCAKLRHTFSWTAGGTR